LAVINSNCCGTETEASAINRTPDTDMSAMTHGRSAIPPILIQASDRDLRRVEERLSFAFRPTYVPTPTFFMITLSVRLNATAFLRQGSVVVATFSRNRCRTLAIAGRSKIRRDPPGFNPRQQVSR